jgi:hypothetical protein
MTTARIASRHRRHRRDVLNRHQLPQVMLIVVVVRVVRLTSPHSLAGKKGRQDKESVPIIIVPAATATALTLLNAKVWPSSCALFSR